MSKIINEPMHFSTPKDPRFLNIVARIAYCNYMNSNDACSDCPVLDECVKWWDHHVCFFSEHLLSDGEMRQLIKEIPMGHK